LLNQLVTCPFEIPLAARMWKRGGGEEGVDETQEGVEGIKIAEGGQKWKQYAGGEGISNKREG